MNEKVPLLPEVEVKAQVPSRVCIATWEYEGLTRNGGIGTAYASLAAALRRGGHEVTVLYLLGSQCQNGNVVDWADRFLKHNGIRLVPLPLPPEPRIHASWASSVSYHAYNWLKEHEADFDVVHFPECQGLAFYSLLAKRQGLAFRDVTFVISTHGPTFWIKEGNQDFIRNVGELEIDYMERVSVAAADVVTSPSRYLLDWIEQRGWNLPRNTYIAPYVLPEGVLTETGGRRSTGNSVSEVVFFGRLEMRKGLKLFCDALDELSLDQGNQSFEVTFLGKETEIFGRSSIAYISDRAKNWSFPWHVLSNKNQAGAVDYLKQPERLAVISSLGDNFPNTVLECIGAGVPFLAARTGGIPEIIAPDDRDSVCFEPVAHVLAERVREALAKGGCTARPTASFAETERKWIRWHTHLADPASRRRANGAGARSASNSIFPLVTVCLAYRTAEDGMAATLETLQQQDYPHFEIILAECGNCADSQSDRIPAEFFQRCRRISQTSASIGTGRNNAARHANGEYLFFVDDHTLLLYPNTLSIFVQVAQRTGADLVTSTLSFVIGSSANRFEHSRRPFLGGDAATGAFINCFGSNNALVRRHVFEALGGFSDEAVGTLDDWELLSKAALRGLQIETIPDALLGYREDTDQENQVHSFANAVRSVRPYTSLNGNAHGLQQVIAKAVLLSQGLKFERDTLIGASLLRGEQGPAVTG